MGGDGAPMHNKAAEAAADSGGGGSGGGGCGCGAPMYNAEESGGGDGCGREALPASFSLWDGVCSCPRIDGVAMRCRPARPCHAARPSCAGPAERETAAA